MVIYARKPHGKGVANRWKTMFLCRNAWKIYGWKRAWSWKNWRKRLAFQNLLWQAMKMKKTEIRKSIMATLSHWQTFTRCPLTICFAGQKTGSRSTLRCLNCIWPMKPWRFWKADGSIPGCCARWCPTKNLRNWWLTQKSMWMEWLPCGSMTSTVRWPLSG